MILSLLTLAFAFAADSGQMKSMHSTLHGEKMIVDYSVLNSGRHVLTVSEITGRSGPKPILALRESVNLEIKKGEYLSAHHGFVCHTAARESVYAVIRGDQAIEKGVFKPLRGWRVDPKAVKLVPIADPKTVECIWQRNGDEDFPFKPAR